MNRFVPFILSYLILINAAQSANVPVSAADIPPINTQLKTKSGSHTEPARLITLAPHLTELVYAMGKGQNIVGTVEYSDFPETAKVIPRVGRYDHLNIEKIASLKPDLILAWKSGNHPRTIERLQDMNIKIHSSEPKTINGLVQDIQSIAVLLNTQHRSNALVFALKQQQRFIVNQYQRTPPIRVFYEAWDFPTYTINNKHIISEGIQMCGGINIFAELQTIAPQVSVESVIQRQPDVIVRTNQHPATTVDWQSLFSKVNRSPPIEVTIDPNKISRPGPRFLSGVEEMCKKMHASIKKNSDT